MKTPAEVLALYKKKQRLMLSQKTPHKEIQPLDVKELLYFKALLHPTDKKESKDLTRELINYICDNEIITAEEIYEKFGWSDKPVMKRLKLFRNFGFIKRECKKYYLPTTRIIELRDKYLERVCT